MCRMYGFRASEPTKVECALVRAQNALLKQSRSDFQGKSHPDGWGVGFYHADQPEIVRSVIAAFEDGHFDATAERVYSRTVIAHVRQASVGGAALVNTHPFTYGPWLFAHNGTVAGFADVAPRLERQLEPLPAQLRSGTTDSELIFCLLLSRLLRAGIAIERRTTAPDEVAAQVAHTMRELIAASAEVAATTPTALNFLLTDGETMIASRYNRTLQWTRYEGIHDCEVCGVPHVQHRVGARYQAVVVASEPISHEAWEPLPDGTVLLVRPDLSVSRLAI